MEHNGRFINMLIRKSVRSALSRLGKNKLSLSTSGTPHTSWRWMLCCLIMRTSFLCRKEFLTYWSDKTKWKGVESWLDAKCLLEMIFKMFLHVKFTDKFWSTILKIKISLKFLEKMPFCPHLKLKINFTTERSSVECTKFRMSRDQMAVPDRASCIFLLVTLKFQPQDQNLVFCATWPQDHWFHIMA